MANALSPIQVALSVDFLLAFSRVQKGMQAKVRAFVEKFMANPTAPGINYETIQGARDANLRSVRIDQAYRGIVLKPRQGNVYALLWVDHHDDAYAWARNRQVSIHPTTGSIQVLTVSEEAMAPPPPADPHEVQEPPLFEALSDADLSRLGVPGLALPRVRAVRFDRELDAAKEEGILPPEAHEGLALVAAGFSVDEVVAERLGGESIVPAPAVDPEDFASAFQRPDSQARFKLITDDAELNRMLDAPLAMWRVFLHPSQRRMVEQDASGSVRVLGGAGTGKTVVAMHRAKHLATKVFAASTDRILVTTYTRNLAHDLKAQLASICSPEALARIEVTNLDAWVSRFLKDQGLKLRVAYDGWRESWETAVNYAPEHMDRKFIREEFEKVVLAQGLTEESEYLTAIRVGRGTQLGRKDRKALWVVFEDYRARLREKGLVEPQDAMREAIALLEHAGPVLPYRAVLVDEAQDFGAQAFKLIRAIVPRGRNDLFIVGDAHQRIYGQKVVLSRCGIEVRGRRSARLKLNYRTTDEIRRWAVGLLEGKPIDDLDGELDSAKGYKSVMHGAPPEVRVFPTFAEEVAYLAERLKVWQSEGGDGPEGLGRVCLVTRRAEVAKRYVQVFEERGIPVFLVEGDGDDLQAPGLRVASMHRVKGLEFDRMLIVGVNAEEVPLASALQSAPDETARDVVELGERSLLYVAATRAKREAIITAWGHPSPFFNAESASELLSGAS